MSEAKETAVLATALIVDFASFLFSFFDADQHCKHASYIPLFSFIFIHK